MRISWVFITTFYFCPYFCPLFLYHFFYLSFSFVFSFFGKKAVICFLPPFLSSAFSSISRSSRGGSPFLCRQRKGGKRAQKGGILFSPFWTPLQGRCGGSPKLARRIPANWASSVRSNSRHTVRVSLPFLSSYEAYRGEITIFTKQKKQIQKLKFPARQPFP